MCGLVGWFNLDNSAFRPYEMSVLEAAIRETASRGTDAFGFYTPEMGVVKYPRSAHTIINTETKTLEEAAESNVFIGHTRAQTSGRHGAAPASENENNHPHEGNRYVLVHNGMFSRLPEVTNYPYKGNCDTELALAFIETFGIRKGLSMFVTDDSYALVIYDKQENQIYFYRHKNPLVFGYDYSTGNMVWGSTTEICNKFSQGKYLKTHGIVDRKMSSLWPLEEETLYTIGVGKNENEENELQLIKLEKIDPCYTEMGMANKFSEEIKLTDYKKSSFTEPDDQTYMGFRAPFPRANPTYNSADAFRDRSSCAKLNAFLATGFVMNKEGVQEVLFWPPFSKNISQVTC